jgi:signal transduction histidine kinase
LFRKSLRGVGVVTLSTYRTKAQDALLDLFAATTGMPVALYEFHEGQLVSFRSNMLWADDEPYCQLIRSLPGGAERCEADECSRVINAMDTCCDDLTLCYAGLYVQVVPVIVDGEMKSVVLYGRMQIEGDEYRGASLEKHRRAVTELGIDESQAAELERLLLSAKELKQSRLEALKTVLPRVEGWFYATEDQLERRIEDVGHELQTGLQAVIANAENLSLEITTLRHHEARKMAQEIIYSAQALDRSVQTFGEYLQDYDFQRQPIAPLLEEAIRVYRSEADRRSIDIHLQLRRVDGRMPVLEVSVPHFQRMLNNLVHNAIKYSFQGSSSRRRYVRIEGYPARDYYALKFENYGVGLLPEEIESGDIYRNGYQGRLTTGEYRTGAGKGLYFVKRIVDQHDGRIEVKSESMSDMEEPGGQPHLTQFVVYLPYEQ